jgi:hypothetical protein
LPDVISDTFDVTVEDATYTFKIPSIKFNLEVGYRAADVRRRCYPEFNGALGSLDWESVSFARYCAIMELYLVRATTGWPFGIADDAKIGAVDFAKPPVIDFEKFPRDCEILVFRVGEAFETERNRFRQRGNTNRPPVGGQAVAGE